MFPYVLGVENVPEFKKWAPLLAIHKITGKKISQYSTEWSNDFNNDNNYNIIPDPNKKYVEFERWKKAICALGYDYHERILNAADFGIPTRRKRYFAFFTRNDLDLCFEWPKQTHDKEGRNGLKKWVACKHYIDLNNEGQSIFGREFNVNIQKGKRKPLSINTLKRIAGGIKKYMPELYFIMHYYGNGTQFQSINTALNTIPTKDRHVLVKLEKLQFIQDHCHSDDYIHITEPLNPILSRQMKQVITIEKIQFANDYYGRFDTAHSLDGPLNIITTENKKNIVTTSVKFISEQYNSNGNPEANNKSLNEPLNAITTMEKKQFISAYFNSNNKPESQNQDINSPLNTIVTGHNKKALVTAIENGDFNFDIKMRFLDPKELATISTFPKGYFSNPLLRLNKKEQTNLIGKAVPPEWARIIIQPVIEELQKKLIKRQIA